MEEVKFLDMIKSFLYQGFSVCYIDKDPIRRALIRNLDIKEMLDIIEPKLSAYGKSHYNILITVDEEDFDPLFRKEMLFIPGYFNDKKSCVIRISTK